MKRVILVIGIFLMSFMTICFADTLTINPEVLEQTQAKFGAEAKERILKWEKLVNDNQNVPELVKLKLANNFFNQVQYAPDEDQWGKRNYWSTPIELLGTNAGDCEDYALSKYYTLVKMGIPISKLRLSYVKSLQLNQPHMVLTYYETPSEEPLILDNLRQYILYASERPDLQPVYSFNGDGLWMTKSIADQNSGKQVGDSNKMTLWIDWKNRMAKEGLN